MTQRSKYFFQNSRDKGNFYATADPVAFEFADVIIVDVNLDVDKSSKDDLSLNSFNVNLENFSNAITTIGKFCKSDALIIVETTVPLELVRMLSNQLYSKNFLKEILIPKV